MLCYEVQVYKVAKDDDEKRFKTYVSCRIYDVPLSLFSLKILA